jgi:hypothetical protein
MKKTYSQNTSKRRESFILSSELREEIELELAQLRQLLGSFQPLREKILNNTPEFVEISALAGFLHAFYTGLENLFKRIAIHLDGGPPRGEAWHTQLLESMSRGTKNRPAVISEPLVAQLRSYLDFRHVFRQAYTFDLRWEKMAGLVRECEKTLDQLESELKAFFKSLPSSHPS